MKSKIIFSTETKDTEHWFDIPFIPRVKEWFCVSDFLKKDDLANIKKSAKCWSEDRGIVQSIEYRYDEKDFYVEMYVWCED